MIEVALNERELAICRTVGEIRQLEAKGWQAQFGDDSSVGRHTQGCVGELAVAKALDRYWTGLEQRAEADVGPYHVRFTAVQGGALPIRPREKPKGDARYVLVEGAAGIENFDTAEVRIIGGILAGAVMNGPTQDPGNRGCPCWMVPQDELQRLTVRDHRFCRAKENQSVSEEE